MNSGNGDFEWWYMMRSRPSGTTVNSIAHARFTEAKINTDGTTVKGVIIFPDYYAGPVSSTNDITWGNKINNAGKDDNWPDWGGTSCTCAGWRTLESEGCVFLPAGGRRSGKTVTWDWNMYATNTPIYTNSFYPVEFRSASRVYTIYFNSDEAKHYGSSVRLVHEVE
jgi:hypothetical protein